MRIEEDLKQGLIAYQQPAYEEALAEVTIGLTGVEETLEVASCTVLLGYIGGTPHGTYSVLYLVYKSDSAVGEGEVIGLPMPKENSWGVTRAPDDMRLSVDGQTLNYVYHYSERSIIDEGTSSEMLIHEAGTYEYTVDLNTGEVTLEIIPDAEDASA